MAHPARIGRRLARVGAAAAVALGLAGCGGSGPPTVAACVPHCDALNVHIVDRGPGLSHGAVTELVLRGPHRIAAAARLGPSVSTAHLALGAGSYTLEVAVRPCDTTCDRHGTAAVRCRVAVRLGRGTPATAQVVTRRRGCTVTAREAPVTG